MPAAARPARPARESVSKRLQSFLERLPSESRSLLAGRLLPASHSPSDPPISPSITPATSARSATSATPAPAGRAGRRRRVHWLEFPRYLAEDGRFLSDLLWAQYCVYCLFRVQDDLVDGDEADPHIAVAANHFLVEAARRLGRHFEPASPFWEVFYSSVDATSSAISEIDVRQLEPHRDGVGEPRLYARLSACLGIACAGACYAAGRRRDWEEFLRPALDDLAIAAQILDDLDDLAEDLSHGRINFAAWYLGQPFYSAHPEAVRALIAAHVAEGDRAGELLDMVAGRLDSASASVASFLPPAAEYIRQERRWVRLLSGRIESERGALGLSVPASAS